MPISNEYYVYALLDPRGSLQRPFYVGKGQGTRLLDHLQSPDSTPKWARILEILTEGLEPIEVKWIENLTEDEAYRLEAVLISIIGTEAEGGPLTNSVRPSGNARNRRADISLPIGASSQASAGLDLLKSSIFQLIRSNPAGLSNADVASVLDLRSHNAGAQNDYLTYSLLGLLVAEGKLRKVDQKYIAV